ncbi:MAG: response regulator [Bacteroidetes bacterium]|nr:response regulator [Bacteroidota bacterium]
MVESREIKPIDILLVEDSPGDADLAKEALEESKLFNNLYTVVDGEEATDFLYKKGKYKDVPKPDLIILDLNLPKKDGREVLKEIKEDETLKRIPVVILTTSRAEEDIIKTYNLHANCYIAKPLDLDKFLDVVKKIEDFWMSIVVLPKDK